MNNRELEQHNALVFSYLTLRKAIGLLGLALPFVVALGALLVFQTGLQGSISGYYYTGMRNVFVGSLWATAFFLLAYKGYGRFDDVLADVGCVAAVTITLFPTAPANPADAPAWVNVVHLLAAAVFFGTLIVFSLVLFTRTNPNGQMTPQKLARNKVYRVCGYVMLACIILILIYFILQAVGRADSLTGLNLVFWLETIALLAFGVSWLTKGEAILQD